MRVDTYVGPPSTNPAGIDGDVQLNVGGVFAVEPTGFLSYDIANKLLFTGLGKLVLTVVPDTSTPGAGSQILLARSVAGRQLLWVADPVSPSYGLQPALFSRIVKRWISSTGAAFNGMGIAQNTTGTLSTPALATTNLLTSVPRSRMASAAGAGSSGEAHSAELMVNRTRGFFFHTQFGFNTAVAQQRAFIGLRNSVAAIGNVNPSTLFDIIGVGYDSAEATLSSYEASAGVNTKVVLATAPVDTTSLYDLFIYCKNGDTGLTMRLKNLSTGVLVLNDVVFNTTIPAVGTFLATHWWVNNGTTAAAAQIESTGAYLEIQFPGTA